MIFLKRTFHPVGQGAFFTEQFYDANQGTLLYDVVKQELINRNTLYA